VKLRPTDTVAEALKQALAWTPESIQIGDTIPPLDLDDDEWIVVDFAGGGGSSEGLKQALGREPDVARNHDPVALAMHAANHPNTIHIKGDIWESRPKVLAKKADGSWRRIGAVWLSPDCTDFSAAKGGMPRRKHIRGLAWEGMRWAALPKPAKPRVIILENVKEFAQWGPLKLRMGKSGEMEWHPDPDRRGQTHRSFVKAWRGHGFHVEWRVIRISGLGGRTIRERLVMIGRSDGLPIRWPVMTHAAPTKPEVRAGKAKPWLPVSDCLDWSIPCPSIFLTREQARKLGCIRPLANATQLRIARGIDRFVLRSADPFLISITHTKDAKRAPRSIREPGPTNTTAKRGETALITPTLVAYYGEGQGGKNRGASVNEPLRTQPTENRHALITSTLIRTAHGERDSRGKKRGKGEHSVGEPLPTNTQSKDMALVSGHLLKIRGNSPGHDLNDPMPVNTAGPAENPAGAAHGLGLSAVYLAQHNAGWNENPGHAATAPLSTVPQKGAQQQLVAAHLSLLRGTAKDGMDLRQPGPTNTADGHHEAIAACFLTKYHRDGGQWQPATDPLHTVPTNDSFGATRAELAKASGAGESMLTDDERYAAWWVARWFEDQIPPAETHLLPCVPAPRRTMLTVRVGADTYAIVDIGMRMLQARELFRANNFPDHYKIDLLVPKTVGRKNKRVVMKPITKDEQNRLCGNCVPPILAKAVGRLQFTRQDILERVYA
jgi:DNA (cytosine-5)-methyltransferase 1